MQTLNHAQLYVELLNSLKLCLAFRWGEVCRNAIFYLIS